MNKFLVLILAVLIFSAAPAVAEEMPEMPRTTTGPRGYTGPAGAPGAQGPQGVPGPPGRPPTQQEVREAVEAYLNSQNGTPAPLWAKPSLEEAVRQGLVQGFPDGKYRWLRPATRAELGIVVERAWVKTQIELGKINTKISNLDGRVTVVEEHNEHQDGTLRFLLRELGLVGEDLESFKALVEEWIMMVVVLLAAAFFATAAGVRRIIP